MSDTSTNVPPADAAAADAAMEPPAPPPAAPAEPAAPEADWAQTDPSDFGSWPEQARDYVKRLREEAKTQREAASAVKPFAEAISGLHPHDQEFMRDFLAALSSRDPNAVQPYVGPLRGLLDQLSPAQQQAVADAAQAASEGKEEFDPYDPAQIDKRFETKLEERLAKEREERDKADEERRYNESVNQWRTKLADKARSLAEEHKVDEFGDPTTDLGRLLYIKAQHDFAQESDPMKRLELAAQSIVERLDTKAQALLKAKAADAGPSPAPADAREPAGARKPRDLAEARKSADERLAKILGGEVGT